MNGALMSLLLTVAQESSAAVDVFTLPHAVAGVMVLSLNAYVLLAGADFGGGVWDLFATGSRKEQQRAAVADAIGPIWEANHVWLILVVVLLFTCFPRAFAHFSTVLHIPITLMLVGIVLRGSAFTFRNYDSKADSVQRGWGRLFAIASVVTPVLLGICVGAVAAGNVPMGEALTGRDFVSVYVRPWVSPFTVAVGVLALALFAHLAAVYLAWERDEPALKNDFRQRALVAAVAVLVAGLVTMVFARTDAPLVYRGLTSGRTALAMHAVTAIAGITGVWALWRRRWFVAVLAAAAQGSFLIWGWAWSQFPWLVPPSHSITSLAAPRETQQLVMIVLGFGTAILLPSFVYLFRIFKGHRTPFEHVDAG
jgi:cytochrome d ubiquinol oxidase subunit II